MPTYKNLPRGKRKQRDEFVDFSMHALIWLKGNWEWVAEVFIFGAIAFAIVLGAGAYWRHRSMNAAEAFYAAERMEAGSEAQIAKLGEIVESYPRAPAGQEAMMMLGNLYFDKKEYDKADDLFRQLVGRSRNHAIMQIAALHRLAESELAGGDPKGAAETYLKAAADPHNIIGPASRFRAAACFEMAGDSAKAEQLYRQVIGDAKEEDRLLRDKSEERLIWIIANRAG